MIFQSKLLLLTPPFTQLNTPYPATAYIKGFLNTLGVSSQQADLGIEVILALFSPQGLTRLFETLDQAEHDIELSDNAYRIYLLRDEYITTIEPVILFYRTKIPLLRTAFATVLICRKQLVLKKSKKRLRLSVL